MGLVHEKQKAKVPKSLGSADAATASAIDHESSVLELPDPRQVTRQ
jgi:hypothetical protein